ncbi:MAG: sugar nucleotide-binding protein [Verrucomicrobiota bacterium]|jgi:dTDP-4-dehydrorhamnose reductase
MILLLGASGFIGRAFANELRRRGHSFIPLTRRAFDYSRFDFLFDYVRTMRPVFLINAAGYSGSGNESATRVEREKMMAANAILPQMIARVCAMTKTPWGHVSSGDIYCGAKVLEQGTLRTETELSRPDLRQLYDKEPERFLGYTELDEPNFSFRNSPSNFYSGTKALAEEAIQEIGQSYIWRPRRPFNEKDETCNWLRQLQGQATIYDHINSISHLEDFVKAALDLWEIRAPFGIYNITNPGAITTREVVEGLQEVLRPPVRFKFGESGEDPARMSSAMPQSNCILDVSKLLKAGVKNRPVEEALKDSLDRMRLAWRSSQNVVAFGLPGLVACFLMTLVS